MKIKKNKWIPRVFVFVTIIFFGRIVVQRMFLGEAPQPVQNPAILGPNIKLLSPNKLISPTPQKVLSATPSPQEASEPSPPTKVLGALSESLTPTPVADKRTPFRILAKVVTSLGSFTMRLRPEIAPKTVENFIGLVEGKIAWKSPGGQILAVPFFKGLKFHRVIPGYFVQTGDPTGSGTGGPGFFIKDEFNTKAYDILPGMVIMANRGKGTAGSQFFITLSEMKDMLDNQNTAFGEITEGLGVVTKISEVKTDYGGHPVQDVTIDEIKIIRIYSRKELQTDSQ